MTPRELQYVKIFRYLAHYPDGQLRSEINSGAGLQLTRRGLKLILEEMVSRGYLVTEQTTEARSPYRYWCAHLRSTHDSASAA